MVPSCPDPTTHQHLPQLTNLKKQPFLWQTPSAGLNCSTSTSATPKQSSGGNPASSTSPSQEGTHRKVQHSLRAQCGEQNLCRVDGTVRQPSILLPLATTPPNNSVGGGKAKTDSSKIYLSPQRKNYAYFWKIIRTATMFCCSINRNIKFHIKIIRNSIWHQMAFRKSGALVRKCLWMLPK